MIGKLKKEHWWRMGCLVCGLAVTDLHAQVDGQLEQEMRLPARLWLETGKAFAGRVSRLTGCYLYLTVQEGEGSVEMGFPVDQIKQLIPPGEKVWQRIHQLRADEQQEQLRLYRLLYWEWIPYLSLLDEDYLRLLLPLAQLELKWGDLYRAIGIATRMLRLAKERTGLDALVRQWEDVVLSGTYSLGLNKQAVALAEQAIRQRDRRQTTLACLILAEVAYTEQEYEQALWMALRPLLDPLSAGQHLEACYWVALAAAVRLQDEQQVHFLLEDRHSLGIHGDLQKGSRYRLEYEQALHLEREG